MREARPLQGVALCVASLFLFACMDTTTKYLSASFNVPSIVAIRYIVNLLLMLALVGPIHRGRLLETQRRGLVVVRALCLASSSILVGFALQRIPVAETTAINFMAPILVVIASGPLLGERIGRIGWFAAAFGFAGVLMIVRPGAGLEPIGVACALAAVGSNLAYQLLSRILAATERTMTMLFYTALVGTVIFGLMLPWFWQGRMPGAFEALLLVSLGIYGWLGHFLYTAAYRYAPASLLAPFNYLMLLWTGLLGWAVFGHVPDRLSALGMLVVAASGVMIALKTRRPVEKREV